MSILTVVFLPILTGDQHSRETCLFDSGCSDQLVSFHGNCCIQGNKDYLWSMTLLCSLTCFQGLRHTCHWFSQKTCFLFFPFQVKTPIVNAKSKVLVPGLPGHQAPVKAATQGSEKRKPDTKEVGEIT